MKKRKLILITILMLITSLSAQNLLDNPESIEYDRSNDRYLISNVGSGDIVQVDSDDNYSILFEDPTVIRTAGLHIVDNILYAAANTGILVIDLTTDELLATIEINLQSFLNDITSDTSGFIYASDYYTNMIYKVNSSTYDYSVLVSGGLFAPNGLYFDKTTNNLLVISEDGTNAPIVSVNINDGSLTTLVETNLNVADGITQDNDGNFLISDWSTGSIYKYNSDFTSSRQLAFSGFNSPADIFYNKAKDVLAVPQFNINQATFLELKYNIIVDKTFGWIPFVVNFTGICEYDVNGWEWDFGDGTYSNEQSPQHSYSSVGIYEATMTIITTGNDTLTRTFDNLVALSDTVKADTSFGEGGQSVAVIIESNNTVALNKIFLPVEYSGNLLLTYDSMSTSGCRTENILTPSISHSDFTNKRFMIALSSTGTSLPSGQGPLIYVYFTLHPTAKPGKTNPINLDGYATVYDEYLPEFQSSFFNYNPPGLNTVISVPNLSCCQGIRGNVNSQDEIDISDLVFYVEYQFAIPAGPAPQCFEEADVNADNTLDIGDIVYLVEFQFNIPPGPPPLDCLQ